MNEYDPAVIVTGDRSQIVSVILAHRYDETGGRDLPTQRLAVDFVLEDVGGVRGKAEGDARDLRGQEGDRGRVMREVGVQMSQFQPPHLIGDEARLNEPP